MMRIWIRQLGGLIWYGLASSWVLATVDVLFHTVCSAGSRAYVQKGIYDKSFKAVSLAREFEVPFNPETNKGLQLDVCSIIRPW